MIEFFKTAFTYDHDMNLRQLEKLQEAGAPEEGIKLLRHISDAETIWHGRLNGLPHPGSPWTDFPANELRERLDACYQNWESYLSGLTETDLEKTLSYRTSKGDPYTNSVRDILFHVINHGTHHRAQISTLLRQHGTPPLPMDFVFYIREKEMSN